MKLFGSSQIVDPRFHRRRIGGLSKETKKELACFFDILKARSVTYNTPALDVRMMRLSDSTLKASALRKMGPRSLGVQCSCKRGCFFNMIVALLILLREERY